MYQIAILFFSLFFALHCLAAETLVSPTEDLQQVINQSHDGDVLILKKGHYQGNFIVNDAISLIGEQGAIIDANGKGHALVLTHSNITIKNLEIVNWGRNLTEQHSGIYAIKNATDLIIDNNRLTGDGFGIWLQKANRIKVLNNEILGNPTIRSADRGNGIQLSIVENTLVSGNSVAFVRDGIYIISSKENEIVNNTMHDLRYGIHYMYSHHNKVLNNIALNTRAGYALMSSKYLEVTGNGTFNSEDYGFLLNFITHSNISNNQIKSVWTKPENKVLGRDGKGFFVYNSAYNTISENEINTTEIGIHLTAGSENTKVFGNSFINNPTQVKYVSNKEQEWSMDNKGNYWSNYLGWDMDGDNVGDVMFEPNDGIDNLMWQYPEMKVLMDSPAVLILRWVQRQFPVLKPPGVKDSFPLMQAPKLIFSNTKPNMLTIEQSQESVTP